MQFDILTIFPEQIEHFAKFGILRIAKENGIQINVHDLRKWTSDAHKSVDDRPYGGGAGMVLKVEPIFDALKEIKGENATVIAMVAHGKTLNQSLVKELASNENMQYIVLCGHYEGFDQRVLDELVDIEISVGDYVLSGGELPALLVVDSVVRLLPGVLGNSESSKEESFENNLLEYPHYTRPEIFNDWKVPEILLSGNHSEIDKWRREEAFKRTKNNRPDLIDIT